MININLFGGPGTGKSTTAAGIFMEMKHQERSVELIQEYAKDLTYGKDITRLQDQLIILGEQHHRLHRLVGQVDYAVHDSPFIMGLSYVNEESNLPTAEFTAFIKALHNNYVHLNIFLERNEESHPYQEYGRSQTYAQALVKDREIKNMLDILGIPYIVVSIGSNTVDDIISILKEQYD